MKPIHNHKRPPFLWIPIGSMLLTIAGDIVHNLTAFQTTILYPVYFLMLYSIWRDMPDRS